MATLNNTSNSVLEMLKAIVTFMTDAANFGTGNQWVLMSPATIDDITSEVILKGVGDGKDEIYIGFRVEKGIGDGQTDLVLNGYAGYDPGLGWLEQPGAIPHTQLPALSLCDTRLTWWVNANTSRVIIVVQLSTQYESAYLGLLKAVAVERQYPYPLAIGGSYIQGKSWMSATPGHSCFINPGSDNYGGIGQYGNACRDDLNENTTSLRIRRPDGVWRSALNKNSDNLPAKFEKLSIWPTNTNPTNVLTVLDNSLTIENVIMFPILLYETFPPGIVGQFDGVYFIGNREDLASKDSIIHNNKTYKVFNNVFRRDNDEYFVIEWA